MTREDRGRPGAATVTGVVVPASAGAALVVMAWSVVGPGHAVFPWLVTCAWFAVAAFVGPGLAAMLPERWSRVSATEVRWHRRLGVGWFDRALEVIGWNRVVRAMRGATAPAGRSGAEDLRRNVRAAMAGHGLAAGAHLVVAGACLGAGAWGGAAVLGAAGVVLHGWPVLLQRSTLDRVERVLRRLPADR